MVSYNKSPDETIQANLLIFFSPLYHGGNKWWPIIESFVPPPNCKAPNERNKKEIAII
jgi:hypothetical protein